MACGIKSIFEEVSDKLVLGHEDAIDIYKFRAELAKVYSQIGEFEIDSTADSMEALIAILKEIHSVQLMKSNLELDSTSRKCTDKCVAHEVIELGVEERLICECGKASKNELDYCTFSHPFYVYEIFEYIKKTHHRVPEPIFDESDYIEKSCILPLEERLPELMKSQLQDVSLNMCPGIDDCSISKTKRTLKLTATPKVFIINLI